MTITTTGCIRKCEACNGEGRFRGFLGTRQCSACKGYGHCYVMTPPPSPPPPKPINCQAYSGWIEAAKYLPPNSDEVFAFDATSPLREADVCHYRHDLEKWFERHHVPATVTHWMPIPPLPKQQDQP